MITPAGKLALEMLVGDQTILNLAREVTAAIDASGADGGIIGGIAVFLHGYERTTTDIDVYTADRPAPPWPKSSATAGSNGPMSTGSSKKTTSPCNYSPPRTTCPTARPTTAISRGSER